MKSWKTQNCQSNLEENEKSRKYNPLRLQTILQSYRNQNSMISAQKQTYGSMEENRESTTKSTHLWLINLWQRRQEYTIGKSFSASGIGKAGKTMTFSGFSCWFLICIKKNLRYLTLECPYFWWSVLRNTGQVFHSMSYRNLPDTFFS